MNLVSSLFELQSYVEFLNLAETQISTDSTYGIQMCTMSLASRCHMGRLKRILINDLNVFPTHFTLN